MRSRIVLAIGLITAVLLVAGLVFCFLPRKTNRLSLAPLPESQRKKVALTVDERRDLVMQMFEVSRLLAVAGSQEEYDKLMPPYLERVSALYGVSVPSEWRGIINPELAKRPLLQILGRKDDGYSLVAVAALAGEFDLQEATPLLIDLLTTRYAGEKFPFNCAGHIAIGSCRALARFAHRGNKVAAEFVIAHAKLAAWNDATYKMPCLKRSESPTLMWRIACDALIFYPCEDSIRALQESGYEHAGKIVYLIRQFQASGDTYEVYWRDVNDSGELSNKYMVDSPWVRSMKTVDRATAPTKAHLIATPEGLVERVRTVRLPGSTNSSASIKP